MTHIKLMVGILTFSLFLVACGAETDSAEELGDTNDEVPEGDETDPEETDTRVDITYQEYTSTEPDCAQHAGEYYSTDVNDIGNSTTFSGESTISSSSSTCTITSNGIPNHDFNDSGADSDPGYFAHDVVTSSYEVTLDRTPSHANSITEFRNGEDEGMMLNGVPISILTSTCWDDACEWRENPFYGPKLKSVDSNHAHSNSSGEYHYHGDPQDLYDASGLTASAVLGYAADGYPIYGPFFEDPDTKQIREVQSSYELQTGSRPDGAPDGDYTGEWREDYAYDADNGDLDECNGMELNGQYAYYVTRTFPYLVSCFKGTADDSFSQRSLSNGAADHVHPH